MLWPLLSPRLVLFAIIGLLLPLHLLAVTALDAGSQIALRFLRAPPAFSASTTAAFQFEIVKKGNVSATPCSDCGITCKLDNHNYTNCETGETSYSNLQDGQHSLEVCIKWPEGEKCESYGWVVDTIPPTAYVATPTSFTNSSNVSVQISFSEPCTGGGGFRCSLNDCSLLVYGAGQVLPSTLKVLQPNIEYSLVVRISNNQSYGRLLLVMDRSFCTDIAGNRFIRTSNSTFILHFDRRDIHVNLRTHIPERILQLNGEMRTVEATNDAENLRIYLYFSEPVLNSSAEILGVLHASSGALLPINSSNLGNRRFGYVVSDISRIAIVTVTCETNSIISRQGTPVSPTDPVTFLYDAEKLLVMIRTMSNMKTREHNIPVLIKFSKPVLDFNSSALQIYGGRLLSFCEISKSIFTIQIHVEDRVISVEVPENATKDLAGNRNLASNRLAVTQYSVPIISSLVSIIATVIFVVTSLCAGLLTLSTASLISFGGFSRTTTYLISEPSRNLLRIACHIQVFALTKWLAVSLPIEYYEFVRGIQWIIPYLRLPWETIGADAFIENRDFYIGTDFDAFNRHHLMVPEHPLALNDKAEANMSITGTPLTPMEYRSFLENEGMKPEAEFMMFLGHQNSWKLFSRNIFWLAVIGGGLFMLHVGVLLTLKLIKTKSDKRKDSGALIMPRFEIFLTFLALPCICQASATIIKGRCPGDIIVGILLLGIALALLLSLILFLSFGITMGKLLQYKEVHQVGQVFHWYQEIIRVSLGPGKKGQWTWMKDDSNSVWLTRLGPMFEDLRGPPKYMLSQISGGRNSEKLPPNRIIASDDETEDAEAPFIQKLFGILRIYYTLLECMKRTSLGILAGVYSTGSRSRVPTLFSLFFTAFQLFFLVLKKPFIKKRVQLVELISVACELSVFVACFVLLEKDLSEDAESRLGVTMLVMFIIGFVAQIINEWYALYGQVLHLSPHKDSFSSGMKTALNGLLLIVMPGNQELSVSTKGNVDREAETGTSPCGNVQRSEKPWLRQLRELAKASFSRDDGESTTNDPSSSKSRSGYWTGKRSRSSSVTSSADSKAKGDIKTRSKGLHKDLEEIFSSK
ncbi:hypothetical protein J5N97_004124 [Dioscorea zingiberensis]|uniref:Bacterial Ig-like domain-containing protein n=1 Tax=Dioscorea zingiberensis TaxID=325984 RepID=A0A9D5D620_9LILI|nr:hypothetical protein J5N97_004124 [Dioscorea zingiberensis]